MVIFLKIEGEVIKMFIDIKIVLIVVFFASMIIIGIRAKKHASSVNGFVLGGSTVGPWLSAFSYGTAYFSAVVFVGYAGQFGYRFGLASTWIGIGNAVIGSWLAWVVLGRRTKLMTRHLQAKTMPEFFEKRYNCKALKTVASIIIFIFLVPYTASVYNGLSRLFAMAFDVPFEICVIVMALLAAMYVVVGGYMATAMNDFIQGIIMLVGIVVVIIAVVNGQGGFVEAFRKLSEIPSQEIGTIGQEGTYTSLFGPHPLDLLGVVLLTSLGTWGLPQMVQKFYSIKDEKAIKIATIVSTGFAIVVAGGTYFMGGFGRLFDNPSLYSEEGSVIYDKIVPHMMSTLPDILLGVVIILVLSASLSTLSSLVLTSSSTVTLDLIRGNLIKKDDEKKILLLLKIFIVVFIIISVVLSLNGSQFIAQLMGISWGALAGAFLAPFLYGLYWKKTTTAAVWVSFASGLFITVGNMLHPITSSINAGGIAMIMGLIIVPVVSLLGKRANKKEVEEMFACFKKQ